MSSQPNSPSPESLQFHADFDREIRLTQNFPFDNQSLWDCWTTEAGLKSFFSQNLKVAFHVNGPFEIFFLMDQPAGFRGSESCTILAIEPPARLAFSWNAPPVFKHCRGQHTTVDLRFRKLDANTTELTLVHRGWGQSEEWDAVFAYFQNAWTRVFQALAQSLNPEAADSF